MTVIKPDVPVPPVNASGIVEAQQQDGTMNQPVVDGGDPIKDNQSNDVEIRKEQERAELKRRADEAVAKLNAPNVAAADLAVRKREETDRLNREERERQLKTVTTKLVTPETKVVPHLQSGSVGTLLGEMGEESAVVHKRIEAILNEHGGKENNIPISNDYWSLLNQYRLLRAQGK